MTQTVPMAPNYATTQVLDRRAIPETGFAVVDIETSGFHPLAAEIVEIAVVLLDAHGTISGTWNSLIKPISGVGPTRIHGITREMVATAPRFDEVARHLHGLLDGRVVAAHNLNFDSKFLHSQFANAGIHAARLLIDGVCTLRLAQRLLPGPSYSLTACCSRVGIELPDAHRPLGDATAAARLLARLLQLRLAPPRPATVCEPLGFDHFANMYRAKLISHVSSIVARLGAHDAEDVVQTTLTQVWMTWLKQGPPDYPLAYLKKSAERVALRFVDSESRWQCTPLDQLDRVAGPDFIHAAGLRIDLQHAVAALPERQRQVMLMHLQDTSNQEIAEKLGIAEGTVAATIHQAQVKLASGFDRHLRKKA